MEKSKKSKEEKRGRKDKKRAGAKAERSGKSKVSLFKEEEKSKIKDTLECSDFASPYLFIMYTGITVFELCALKWEDYDALSSSIKIRSRRKRNERIIKLTDRAKTVIASIEKKNPKDPIFTGGESGNLYSYFDYYDSRIREITGVESFTVRRLSAEYSRADKKGEKL